MESTQAACSSSAPKEQDGSRLQAGTLVGQQAALAEYSAALEKLAGDLADQRLHVAEQCERLALAQTRWQEECETARQRLAAGEDQLRGREQEMAKNVANLRQGHEEAAKTRLHLATLQARLTAQVTAWEGERHRWIAHLRGREELIERSLTILGELRSRWRERHDQELEQLRIQRADFEEGRRELVAHRDLWFHRCQELEREQRTLLRRLFSLDKNDSYQHEKSQLGPGKKLSFKWGRRLAALSATLGRTVIQELHKLQIEADKLETRFADLQKLNENLAARENDLAEREIALDHNRALAESDHARLRQELQSLNDQKNSYERQLADLKEEVERLAALLLEERDTMALPTAKAA